MDEKIEKYILIILLPVTQRNILAELKPLISFGSPRGSINLAVAAKCYVKTPWLCNS
jgi:hypothetical protein